MLGKRVRIGLTQKKILLFLQAGLALGLSHSPKQQAWILNQMPRELEKINRQTLNRAIYSLYHSHLIEEKEHKDGSCTFFLSHEGKEKVLRFNIEEIKETLANKTVDWDVFEKLISWLEVFPFMHCSLKNFFICLGFLEVY